jgi:HEAT repeat protein
VNALRSRHAVPALIDALEDDGVVDAAVSSLGRIGDRRATEALANLLRRHLSEARTSAYPLCVAAVNALGSIGDRTAVPALSAALEPRQWATSPRRTSLEISNKRRPWHSRQ